MIAFVCVIGIDWNTCLMIFLLSFQVISQKISDKILREAFNQQKEIEDEENIEQNPTAAAFNAVGEVRTILDENEEDIDDYAGLPRDAAYFEGDYEVSSYNQLNFPFFYLLTASSLC